MEKLGIFIFGGPGSGKDYVLKNIFSRFDLIEVQADQVLNGAATSLISESKNIVINCSSDCEDKIQLIKSIMEGYTFDHVFVYVSNKVSRERNQSRTHSLREDVRIRKLLKADKFASNIPDIFTFNNSINLPESSDFEKLVFANQIEKLLERITSHGLKMKEKPEAKSFSVIKENMKKMRPLEWGTTETTNAYKAMTPGEGKNGQAIQASMGLVPKDSEEDESEEREDSEECGCGGACGCGGSCGGACGCEGDGEDSNGKASTARRTIKTFRQQQEETSQIGFQPTLKTKPTKKVKGVVPGATFDPTKDGMYSYGGMNPQTNY